MKKLLAVLLTAVMLLALAGCGGSGSGNDSGNGGGSSGGTTGGTPEGDQAVKLCLIVTGGTLGDQANNDAMYEGIKAFADGKGIKFDAVELAEVADIDTTVRTMASDGYTFFAFNSPDGADLLDTLCPDLPGVTFVMYNGTNAGGYSNLTNVTTDVAGAGFLCAIFGCLMNEIITGEKAVGYIGGVRNPNLERVRYSMQAAAELIGGRLDAAYVGNFTDAAAGKEIAQQMQSGGVHVIQAWGGGANKGVYEAAETAGEGYYSLGAANGQYHMSNTIIASLNTRMGAIMEDICTRYAEGTLEAGVYEASVMNGMVDCIYAPDERADVIPDEVTAVVEEYRQKLVSGELTAPTTEEEYNAFVTANIG